MRREEDQELWELLGKASKPELSPFFARNVVRQVRQESSWKDAFSNWLRPRRLIPAAALAAAIALAATLSIQPRPEAVEEGGEETLPELLASIDPQDFEVIAELDDLLAAEDDSAWTDSSPL